MLELWLSFSAGLIGSGHCLGMCGGIVTALALSKRDAAAVDRFLFNLLYHVGRVCTYSILGLLVGLVIQAGMVDSLKPAVKWLFLAANFFVMVVGICTLFGVHSLGISALDGTGSRFFKAHFARLAVRSTTLTALPAGLLMGLLPCGLVYGILIAASTSGSAVKGAGMMFAFGCGTIPVLLSYGQMASALSVLSRGLFQRGMGGVVALIGLLGVWKALDTLGVSRLWQ
ncbi:MAG: sulfite exporter TauE/SafE family protein [Desulfuromonadaceae bacterium]|nr:sulfite exporter TauE/SafE family protein [Desulfuromonadaceae bacterium]MDD5107196.1 sulfite exporter TauE/SafE family protein [Desulfuromonadaceae bacterium]